MKPPRAELGEAVRARVSEELSATDDLDWLPEDRMAFGALAEEIAWLTVDLGQDEDETPDEAPDGPQRWVRGVLRVRGREITVEVNSQQRLIRLLGILRKIGGKPVVTSEKRIDPAQDFGWAAGQRAAQGGAAAAADGWEKFWLDEKVPALGGRTPRQAARGPERAYLEAMLRQFEYGADLLTADGKTGVDTDWLRERLGMPSVSVGIEV